MLGKLLKYEIKATARLFLPLYLTILVFAIINRFFFGMPNIGNDSMSINSLAMAISMFIYVTLMVGMLLMTLIVMIQRFYKNLLGDEGYLMFTLPVQSWSHILSKLTTSMLWTIVSGVVALCSILIIASKNIFIPEIYKRFSVFSGLVREYLGGFTFVVSFEVIVFFLLSLASSILTIYAAIALGHLFNKYKLLTSLGMYIALNTLSQMLMTFTSFIFSNQITLKFGSNSIPSAQTISSLLLGGILYFVVINAGYFVLTNYILKRKLNLE